MVHQLWYGPRPSNRPPGFAFDQRPYYLPGISANFDVGGDARLVAIDLEPKVDVLSPEAADTAALVKAICAQLTKSRCLEPVYQEIRKALRLTPLRAAPPTWQEPPLGARSIMDTNPGEIAVAAGGGTFTDLISFRVPDGNLGVVYAVGADVLPVGLDEENLVRYQLLVNGIAPQSNTGDSSGGAGFDAFSEQMGSIADPFKLKPAIRLKPGDSFFFGARDIDANAPATIRPVVLGYFFAALEGTREGAMGWMVD